MDIDIDGNGGEKDTGQKVLLFSIKSIRPYIGQPRKWFNPIAMRELTESIQEDGQLTPGHVRRLDPPEDGYTIELIDGERRLRACILAGLKKFKAIIDEVKNDDDQFIKSAGANFHRESHPPLECAHVIDKMQKAGLDYQIICKKLGRSITWVTQHHKLLSLHPDVLERLDPALPEKDQLTFSHAVLLTGISQQELQVGIARRIISQKMGLREASHLIKRALYQSNPQAAKRNSKAFKEYAGFVSRTETHIDLLLQLSPEEIRAALMSRQLQERMKLPEGLVRVIDKLTRFKANVDAALLAGPNKKV